MEKRIKKRFARRLQVMYWPQGEDHERKGYTTNVSATGAFIATNAPHPPHARMRMEFLGPQGFTIEAVVVHAARVATSLQSIRSSGMGVRFLLPAELVHELLPPGREEAGESREQVASDLFTSDEPELTLEEAIRLPKKRASAAGGVPVFTVSFRDVAHLLDTLETEITFGGVFVPTKSPAALHEQVRVALALPAPIKRTVNAEATVVQLVGLEGDGRKSGMGVAFTDTEAVVTELRKWIDWAPPETDDG